MATPMMRSRTTRRSGAVQRVAARIAALALAWVGAVACPAPAAHACSTHGTRAGNGINEWIGTGVNPEGFVEALLSIEDNFVVPTTSAVCVCGIGLGMTDNRLPTGVVVNGAHVGLLNTTTGELSDLPAFEFAANATTTTGLEVGGDAAAPTGTQLIFDGATWFGFSALVEPFELPEPGPDELLVLGFDLGIRPEDLPLSIEVQFAAGGGDSAGGPLFVGPHSVQYYTGKDPVVELVPEPGEASQRLACGVALAALASRRRATGRPAPAAG